MFATELAYSREMNLMLTQHYLSSSSELVLRPTKVVITREQYEGIGEENTPCLSIVREHITWFNGLPLHSCNLGVAKCLVWMPQIR